jgi:putative flavoprotein involved in K+ transport
MTETEPHYPVIVVGAGQAGLSMSWYLKRAGISHLVLERHEPAYTWRHERWDSFCLVTPNWQCQLPGYPYQGSDPHGFMPRDQIVEYITGFAASFDPPVETGVTIEQLLERPAGGFALTSKAGKTYTADQVVVATGGYHDPITPPYAAALDTSVLQVHAAHYRNPAALPAGEVLVVGTGQSGAQLAEDLHLAGRRVHLCVGEAPRVARFYRGKDVVEWLHLMGYYDMPVDRHPLREGVRDKTNHYVTGRDGGRDIDLRRFALEGMQLYGSLAGISDGVLSFQPNLTANLDEADNVSESIKRSIDGFITAQGITAPEEPPYRPVWQPAAPVLSINYRTQNITSVLWCIGFRANYRWVQVPVFDGAGRPVHQRGVTRHPGLYFLGLPWLYSWGSGRLSGVSRDAGYLAEKITHARSLQAAA